MACMLHAGAAREPRVRTGGGWMIYQAFQAQSVLFDLMRPMASLAATNLRLPWPSPIPETLSRMAAKLDVFAGLRIGEKRPAFDLKPIDLGNRQVAIEEEVVAATAFNSLLHFRKDVERAQPRVLVVAPMSGHFATLLRATVQTLLIDHDVYITDWHNIRDVPKEAGPFSLSTYVEEVQHCLRTLGEGTHVVAVCQPVVPALAAAALMAEDDDPAQPRSLTLMAAPSMRGSIPPRSTASPTSVRSSGSSRSSRTRCRPATRARAGASIPASCSSPPSWR